MKGSTQRFSDRVDAYIKYRPSYPAEIVKLLKEKCGLTEKTVIADIGSGTGIFTKLLLDNGNQVFAVEPNKEMRQAAELQLKNYPDFVSIDAPAEKTGLKSNFVDIITSAQAFHWFDREKVKVEFSRIIRPGGWVVLIWNERQTNSSAFLTAYEALLHKYAKEYGRVNHTNIDSKVIAGFFSPCSFEAAAFQNSQDFDYEGLKGRLLSSSYAPDPGRPEHAPMISELEKIFQTYAKDEKVIFEYKTIVYYGQFSSSQ